MQAKDIPEERLLDIIGAINDEGSWAFTWDVYPALAEFPHKVVLAKLRSMIRRGVIVGCGCGCRGDFYIEGRWPNDKS